MGGLQVPTMSVWFSTLPAGSLGFVVFVCCHNLKLPCFNQSVWGLVSQVHTLLDE